MDRQEFRQNALRTEPSLEQYEEAGARLIHPAIAMALNVKIFNAIQSLSELDDLKKHIFYGRQTATTDAYFAQHKHFEGDNNIQKTADAMGILNDQTNIRILHGALGIATEGGEILEAVSALVHNGTLDGVNIGEEIGDVNWYEEVLGDTLGFKTDDVNVAVIKKLKARFPDKFNGQSANNRDLNTEREILEEGIQ